MFSKTEQFSFASKDIFESQVATFNTLANRAVDGGQKAIALNLATAKAFSEEAGVVAQRMFSAKDPQTLVALVTAQVKVNANNVVSYARSLAEIVSSVSADFTKAADAQMIESKSKVVALMNEAIKNMPTGSENAVAMFKSVIGNANAGYDQMTKANKENVDTVNAHVAKVTDQLSQAVTKGA
jgi:phasin family protein